MYHNFLLILILLFAVFLLMMLAQTIKISYPIFLVIAGLGISYLPGLPVVNIDPHLIFLIFLPPLLYEAAWYTSWNDFWRLKRPIGLLAFGLVIFTSAAVAYVSNAVIPGFTLSLGFLLGGIISPPDAVAASSVLKDVKVPKRIITILQGESLINDASSLIVFRFALAAVLTGQFSMQVAVSQFFIVTFAGILIGLSIAHVMYVIHRFLPTTPSIDAALTLISPYFMYIAAEEFHYSGVMAVVSGGLFLSYRSHEIFAEGQNRIQTIAVWSTLISVLNGLVFILIGLELPLIVRGLGNYSVGDAWKYALLISAVIIVVRLVWIYPAAYIPRWLFKGIRNREDKPGWKQLLLISWAGMRGVVSLASALSIPLLLENGKEFPHRNLILFITFIVILITLVFQGLSLPLIARLIKIEDAHVMPPGEQEAGIRIRMMKASLERLNKLYAEDAERNELVGFLKSELENDITAAGRRLQSLSCDDTDKDEIERYNSILYDLYNVQRLELFKLKTEKIFSDEEIRKQEMQVDLDQMKISRHPD